MKNLENMIVEHFKCNNIKYTHLENTTYWYRADFADDVNVNRLFVGFDNDDEILRVFCVPDKKIPVASRSRVSEFLIRLNYRFSIGTFQLDWSDGEIRFTCVIDTEDVVFTEPALRRMLSLALSMVSKYMPFIMKVVYADLSPEEVFKLAGDQGE